MGGTTIENDRASDICTESQKLAWHMGPGVQKSIPGRANHLSTELCIQGRPGQVWLQGKKRGGQEEVE